MGEAIELSPDANLWSKQMLPVVSNYSRALLRLMSFCESHCTREHVTPEMNKLRQSLRRKKPTYVPEASRPHQWQADEEAVRKGKCNFAVRVSSGRVLVHS
ncbi:hypothetical protein F2P81_017438 [Scophthalmus maximus]|uniref:Uncharacterized protein n=1 Tax=Scophthalmus maximus TaxID=52904 RepID=A0A6A4SBZ2_SCOMX|nr:hypothetical protein F2P81_017438 [Scophthalmus maximus]